MGQHSLYRFSVTVETAELAIVYCLRSLSDYAQDTGNSRITWGGTKDDDWRLARGKVTFRFSKPEYREDFLQTATRLLKPDSWREVARSDSDPARPQV